MRSPATARRGMWAGELGMLLAVAVIVAVILVLHPERVYLYPLIGILPLIFGVLMMSPIPLPAARFTACPFCTWTRLAR